MKVPKMTKSEEKQLWKIIFEQEHITNRIIEISSEPNGISICLETYGTVQLLVKPATAIGDNYLSDTFYITAVLSNGVEHKAFVKVIITLLLSNHKSVSVILLF